MRHNRMASVGTYLPKRVRNSEYVANKTKGFIKSVYGFQVFWLCICTTLIFLASLSNLKVAVMGQRSGKALSLLYS